MMKLVLVRHSESKWNRKNLLTSWMGMDLSDKGHEGAKAAGQLLKAEGYNLDICFTSYLKRTAYTLSHILDEMDRDWLEAVKSWKLSERRYGALQGLNKTGTAEKYGEEQIKIWHCSFSTKPPVLDPNDDGSARKSPTYRDVGPALLLDYESLETMIKKTVPYFDGVIRPEAEVGKRIIIAAHGNSLHALVKYPDSISEEDIIGVNIPTGTPLVYEFDDSFKLIHHYYLDDQEAPKKKVEAVADQGKRQT